MNASKKVFKILTSSLFFILFVLGLVPKQALATFSIVGTDRKHGEVGAALATCWTAPLVIQDLYASVPGKGGILSQASNFGNGPSQDKAVQLIQNGVHPEDIRYTLLNPYSVSEDGFFDSGWAGRQIGIANMYGQTAPATCGAPIQKKDKGGISGEQISNASGQSAPRFTHSAQGNFLTVENVVEAMSSKFVDQSGGCDLAEKLINSLLAGEALGGDGRCAGAKYAFLVVQDKNGNDIIRKDAKSLNELITYYNDWRTSHECNPLKGPIVLQESLPIKSKERAPNLCSNNPAALVFYTDKNQYKKKETVHISVGSFYINGQLQPKTDLTLNIIDPLGNVALKRRFDVSTPVTLDHYIRDSRFFPAGSYSIVLIVNGVTIDAIKFDVVE